jgi:hypothetical protein
MSLEHTIFQPEISDAAAIAEFRQVVDIGGLPIRSIRMKKAKHEGVIR